ncbi:helix-turn-helix domain-containing protein [Enterococcus ureasiticus]|uniref:helix-turn-helix domain-containing protein n=1 Tax=Enterococcus ureasiticus TaxID=903984 RepID=UPI001A8EC262|nr:helix-turn-helix domain-containing protein [Enterococcus ureasiticus]MBO0475034.1 helix-turn-helix domain-containing protein [Enterococcus ureasiticus]
MEFFLNDKNKKKLELFKELIFKDGGKVSFTYLQDYLDISLSTLKLYFNELEADIQKNDDLKMIVFEKSTGGFQVNNHSEFKIDYLVVHLRLHYLNESLQFKIISSILSKSYLTADELADDLFVSIPYLYKQINVLNEQLKSFHIKVVFHSNENLCGEEKHFRMFCFYFYWNAYRGIFIPFESELSCVFTCPDIIDSLERRYSSSVIKRIKLMLGITIMRQYKYPVQLPMEIKNILKPLEITTEISILVKRYFLSEEEHLFFNLMLRSFISDIDSSEEKISLFNLFPRSSSLVFSSELLVNEYERNFYPSTTMTPTQKASIFYYVLIGIVHSTFFEINPMYFFRQAMISQQDNTQFLKKYLKRHPKNYRFYKKFRNNHPEFTIDPAFNFGICMLLTIFTDMFLIPKVSIYIQYTSNNYGTIFIKNRLLTFFNSESINFTNQIDEADIAIVDNFEFHKKRDGQTFFFVNSFLEERMWLELIIVIQKFLLNSN